MNWPQVLRELVAEQDIRLTIVGTNGNLHGWLDLRQWSRYRTAVSDDAETLDELMVKLLAPFSTAATSLPAMKDALAAARDGRADQAILILEAAIAAVEQDQSA